MQSAASSLPKRKTPTSSNSKKKIQKKNNRKEKESSEESCSDYLKMVKQKQMKNKQKLEDLGLVKNNLTPKRRNYQRKNKSPSEECPYDHNCFSTSYMEEKDKRYLDKKFDLFGVKCQGCAKCFSKSEEKDTLTPSNAAPMYVCRGRGKHKCLHSYCFTCYQSRFMEHNPSRSRRCRIKK